MCELGRAHMNTEIRKHKRHDEAFKRSAVEHWLVSGKSVRQIAVTTNQIVFGEKNQGRRWISSERSKIRVRFRGMTFIFTLISSIWPENKQMQALWKIMNIICLPMRRLLSRFRLRGNFQKRIMQQPLFAWLGQRMPDQDGDRVMSLAHRMGEGGRRPGEGINGFIPSPSS